MRHKCGVGSGKVGYNKYTDLIPKSHAYLPLMNISQ